MEVGPIIQDDPELMARVPLAGGDEGCAAVPEVEEVGLLPFQAMAEQTAGDLDDVIPLLPDVDEGEAGRWIRMHQT